MTAALAGVPRHFMMHPWGWYQFRAHHISHAVFRRAKGLRPRNYAMTTSRNWIVKMDCWGRAGFERARMRGC
jgi:hypothetical protein